MRPILGNPVPFLLLQFVVRGWPGQLVERRHVRHVLPRFLA